MRQREYRYQSPLGTFIEAHIREKQLQGFIYHSEEYILKSFDLFCYNLDLAKPIITRELLMQWSTIRETEGKVYAAKRVSAVRQLALYMQSQGLEAYVPTNFSQKSSYIAHILIDKEITELFSIIDAYRPKIADKTFIRLSTEYKVLFRLIYCCGLRVSEARKLLVADVDLIEGSLKLKQSKGRKDRLVYLSKDLLELCSEYHDLMKDEYQTFSEWFFPARNPDYMLSVGTIGYKFRQFWSQTSFAKDAIHPPTVHSLRYGFVVKRINLWMKSGLSLQSMMPYLSKHLGHSSPEGTFYYYHQIEEAFNIIRERDTSSAKIIPEVNSDD